MNKFRIAFWTILGLLLTALPTFAQAVAEAGDNANSVNKFKALAAGLGFGIAAGLGGIGQGLIASRAAEGAARNPGASSKVQVIMIIGLAFVETLVIFTLVIVFAKL